MKIIFLNTWDGKREKDLREFFKVHALDTDVFCLQEAYERVPRILEDYLKEFNPTYVTRRERGTETSERYAQATFVRKSLTMLGSEVLVDENRVSGLGLANDIRFEDHVLHICNYHGIARPIEKIDSPERLRESQRILDYYKEKVGPTVIGGDFNLLPDTRSIELFREHGYRNLIAEYAIATTRNRFAWDRHPNKLFFCDYVFVSPEVRVKEFGVPNVEVSDHLPLILDIE